MRLSRSHTALQWTHIHETPPIERRQWQPCAQPMPDMCVAKGTHSHAMGGVKWVPTDFTKATAKLLQSWINC